MAFDANSIAQLYGIPLSLLLIVIVWSFIWKGFALWKAARRNSMVWFIVLLVVNTMGILEILYLFLFSELKFEKEEVKKSRKRATTNLKKRVKK